MPTFEAQVTVSIHEFIDHLDQHDIEKLVKYLKDRNYISKGHKVCDILEDIDDAEMSVGQLEIAKAIKKISENTLRLSHQQEEIIIKIAENL